MTESIIPLRFNVEDVGKHVKSSKKRFTWQISLKGKQHSIVLQFSFISGKVKITVDRKILLENQLPASTSFQYPFTLDGNSLNVIQLGEQFELRINNKAFSHLYNQAKTNKQFKKYEDEVKDFKVDENQFLAKKITLKIGGVEGGMKKKAKNQSGKGHNWNVFDEDQLSGFPNYFEGQSVSTASSSKIGLPIKNMQTNSDSLLDVDSGMSLTKNSATNQNILDFDTQFKNFSNPPHQSANKVSQQFSTMQLIFQTMNFNQQNKPTVIINSNEADFFNSSQKKKMKQGQPSLDFFADLNNNQAFSTPPLVTKGSPQNLNAFQYTLPTNQVQLNNFSNQLSQQWNPQINNVGLNMGFNTEINPNAQNTIITLNPQTKPLQTQTNLSSYSTLQGLFATNTSKTNQTTAVSTTLTQPQTNPSLNTHQFPTQGISNQASNSSLNINTQQFEIQNFNGHQGLGQQINFLQQSKVPTIQQPIIAPQLLAKQSEDINIKDFNSMQLLFQTNAVQPRSQQGNQTPVQKSYVDALNQQFSTMVTSTTQSPNSMFMNTYCGKNNQGAMGLDLNMNFNQQQFNTSVNSPMMKKQSLKTIPAAQSSINTSDLL